ncbi:succinate--CoA ligase subunit beta [Pseudomonas sp.]|uniref:succinate--CoA ligase subunit beta n=1 Tax=Pseudomonas sp. TaxID=306 RepID=UPI0028A92497|nr:ATP-grasp domain-containing protein [Pseudomonas sp.]
MDFVEYAGKQILAAAGLVTPRGIHCTTADEVVDAVRTLGPSAIKAQVPIGKRGKAGGIKLVGDEAEARGVAGQILGMSIGGYTVPSVLVEQKAAIIREFYAAVMNDTAARQPLILFSAEGGMDIEELAESRPEAICRIPVDIEQGLDARQVNAALAAVDLGAQRDAVAELLVRLYEVYLQRDAELVEINPLAVLADGTLVALDCKFRIDDSAGFRQAEHLAQGTPEPRSELEGRGAELGFKYIELDGEVGLLANGAGLTMTTMDVIAHCGGRAANFLEIGGDAYTKATPALELVLANPKVKSLVVNFCGAFARTDVMTQGVVDAWTTLRPTVPVFFSIHGTGEEEAVAILQQNLGIEPYDRMEDAVQAAVEAAR